jgi:hypothetical protein
VTVPTALPAINVTVAEAVVYVPWLPTGATNPKDGLTITSVAPVTSQLRVNGPPPAGRLVGAAVKLRITGSAPASELLLSLEQLDTSSAKAATAKVTAISKDHILLLIGGYLQVALTPPCVQLPAVPSSSKCLRTSDRLP